MNRSNKIKIKSKIMKAEKQQSTKSEENNPAENQENVPSTPKRGRPPGRKNKKNQDTNTPESNPLPEPQAPADETQSDAAQVEADIGTEKESSQVAIVRSGDPLTEEQRLRLTELEETIQAGLENALEVGKALLEIRHKKLYREEFDTFQDYCKARGYSRATGYRMMGAVKVKELAASIRNAPPITNEAQARELVGLDKGQLGKVLRKAKKDAGEEGLTAALLREARNSVVPKEPKAATTTRAQRPDVNNAANPVIPVKQVTEWLDEIEEIFATVEDETLSGQLADLLGKFRESLPGSHLTIDIDAEPIAEGGEESFAE